MKLLLSAFILLSLNSQATTFEECRTYNDSLVKSVVEVDTDEVHPYQLRSSKEVENFDPAKLGIDLNKETFKKWRGLCKNKPDISQPFCQYAFPAMNFMKATIAGIKTGGWDEKTKALGTSKIKEFLKYSMENGYTLLDILITEDVLEDARANGVLNPDEKELTKLRKDTEMMREKLGHRDHKKEMNCKEAEALYKKELAVVDSVKPRLIKILRSVL